MNLLKKILKFFHFLFPQIIREYPTKKKDSNANGTSSTQLETSRDTNPTQKQPDNTAQTNNTAQTTEKLQNLIVSETYTVKTVPFLTSKLNLDYNVTYKVLYSIPNSVDYKFPIIRAPKRGCEIKLPIIGRSGKRGVCEESLCKMIKQLGLPGFYDNLSLFVGNYSNPYEPDIAYIDAKKSIFIDIEIDEPYSGWERTPIHYKTKNGTIDDLRNQYFTERGWTVIRFSEKQVYKYPKSCLKRIYQVLNKMDATINMPQCLAEEQEISLENMWTKEEAERQEQNRVREKMLGINTFVKPDKASRTPLKDYSKGVELEKEISKKKNNTSSIISSYRPPQPAMVPISNINDVRRREAEQYEHQKYISTQSKPKTTPSSRGYA